MLGWHPTPRKCFFSIVLLLIGLIHIFYISEGWLIIPTSCSKLQISLIHYSHNLRNCTYIHYFNLHTVFNHVPGMHTTPSEKVFFSLSIVLLLTSSFIYFLISEGVVSHSYTFAQNCKYRWYSTLMTSEIVPIFIILGCTRFSIMW